MQKMSELDFGYETRFTIIGETVFIVNKMKKNESQYQNRELFGAIYYISLS